MQEAERKLVEMAKIGINALVDEVTGYQNVRAKDDLRKQYVGSEENQEQEREICRSICRAAGPTLLNEWKRDQMAQQPSLSRTIMLEEIERELARPDCHDEEWP